MWHHVKSSLVSCLAFFNPIKQLHHLTHVQHWETMHSPSQLLMLVTTFRSTYVLQILWTFSTKNATFLF